MAPDILILPEGYKCTLRCQATLDQVPGNNHDIRIHTSVDLSRRFCNDQLRLTAAQSRQFTATLQESIVLTEDDEVALTVSP